MKQTTNSHFEKLIKKYSLLSICADSILNAYKALLYCYSNNGKILICGNGGSAADSNHIVGELMKGFLKKRPLSPNQIAKFGELAFLATKLQNAIPAISLCEHSALITAYSNDVEPEMIFAQQVFGLCTEKDVLIGLSTSGNSKNITNALQVAKIIGAKTISMTGATGGTCKEICDVSICVPETETYIIQELHLPIYHCLCAMLEEEIF